MGMLSRLIGQARTSAPAATGRSRRTPGRRGAAPPAATGGSARGLGKIAQRVMGGRRRGGL